VAINERRSYVALNYTGPMKTPAVAVARVDCLEGPATDEPHAKYSWRSDPACR